MQLSAGVGIAPARKCPRRFITPPQVTVSLLGLWTRPHERTGLQRFGAQVAIQYQNYELDANNAGTAMNFDDIDVITLQTIFNF